MAAGLFGKVSCRLCEEQEGLKEIHQCNGGPERWMILRGAPDQFEIDRCPMSYIEKDVERAFFLYNHYCEGRLPIRGGILDQIHTGLEAFELIADYLDMVKRK